MPLHLVSMEEVHAAIATLEVVTIRGEQYVDARALARALGALDDTARFEPRPTTPGVNQRVEELRTPPAAFTTPADDEDLQRALAARAADALAANQPVCIACAAGCSGIAHPDGRCVECDCTTYAPEQVEPAAPVDDDGRFAPAITVGDADPTTAGIFTKGPMRNRPPAG